MNGRPGLAPERTRLAWDRTGLGMAAFSLVLFRFALLNHNSVELAAAAMALLNAILVEAVAVRRVRAGRSANAGEVAAIVAATSLIALLTGVGLLLV